MHVQGQNRDQATLFPERLDDLIGEDNAVRVIDAFVDSLDLKTLGFARIEVKATGRPPYHPGDLLKLYLYGYMHRVRSSRRLERECHTNLEVLWLLNRLAPDHKTIANFRVDNRVALTRVCRAFVQFCRSQSLYGGDTIAIDGSKFTADNNRSKVTRKKDLKRQLQRLDTEIATWLDALEDNDDDDEPPSGGGNTQAALEVLETERATLTERIRAMDEAGLEVQPDTDPEARVMRHGHVGYNVQSSVDGKHRLIVDVDVVQSAADQDQLYRMARRSQRQLQENKIQVLADSGYSSGWHFKRCQAHGLTPYVPVNRSINNHGDGRDLTEEDQVNEESLVPLYHRSLHRLPAPGALHDREAALCVTPLRGGRAQRGRRADRGQPDDDAATQRHGRAPVRHAETAYGWRSVTVKRLTKGQSRDIACCNRLQPDPRHQHPGNTETLPGTGSLTSNKKRPPQMRWPLVFTRPPCGALSC
jgi:transposase